MVHAGSVVTGSAGGRPAAWSMDAWRTARWNCSGTSATGSTSSSSSSCHSGWRFTARYANCCRRPSSTSVAADAAGSRIPASTSDNSAANPATVATATNGSVVVVAGSVVAGCVVGDTSVTSTLAVVVEGEPSEESSDEFAQPATRLATKTTTAAARPITLPRCGPSRCCPTTARARENEAVSVPIATPSPDSDMSATLDDVAIRASGLPELTRAGRRCSRTTSNCR